MQCYGVICKVAQGCWRKCLIYGEVSKDLEDAYGGCEAWANYWEWVGFRKMRKGPWTMVGGRASWWLLFMHFSSPWRFLEGFGVEQEIQFDVHIRIFRMYWIRRRLEIGGPFSRNLDESRYDPELKCTHCRWRS